MAIIRRTATRLTAALLATVALLGAVGAPTARADTAARYTVTVKSFKAIEESGNDWFGSDEVYGGFEVTDPYTDKRTAGFRSQLIKGFDSGETKSLDPERNCLPHRQVLERVGTNPFLDARAGDRWLCTRPDAAPGMPAPFTVTGHLWEQESCPVDCTWLRPYLLSPWLVDDESLGRAQIPFSVRILELDLPTVGLSRDYPMEHRDSGAAYRTTLNVKRVL